MRAAVGNAAIRVETGSYRVGWGCGGGAGMSRFPVPSAVAAGRHLSCVGGDAAGRGAGVFAAVMVRATVLGFGFTGFGGVADAASPRPGSARKRLNRALRPARSAAGSRSFANCHGLVGQRQRERAGRFTSFGLAVARTSAPGGADSNCRACVGGATVIHDGIQEGADVLEHAEAQCLWENGGDEPKYAT